MGRYYNTATLLDNGNVLVTGGTYNHNGGDNVATTVELYDPSSGTWSLTGSLHVARDYHTATLLDNGNVLVAGGIDSSSSHITTTVELYDSGSGTWSLTGSMNVGRFYHTATLLANGEVLVATGDGSLDSSHNPYLASAELYVNANADSTAPVLQLPNTITVNAASPSGVTVTYSVTATDPDDPLSQLTITCSPVTGTTFASGTTTVTCTASDPAGNSANGSFSVVVVGASDQLTNLISLVNSFHLKHSIQRRLDTQLHAVQVTVGVGKKMLACQQLAAFSHLVRIFTGRSGLTSLQAQQLLAASITLQKALGC